jgi:hypothetical protein
LTVIDANDRACKADSGENGAEFGVLRAALNVFKDGEKLTAECNRPTILGGNLLGLVEGSTNSDELALVVLLELVPKIGREVGISRAHRDFG